MIDSRESALSDISGDSDDEDQSTVLAGVSTDESYDPRGMQAYHDNSPYYNETLGPSDSDSPWDPLRFLEAYDIATRQDVLSGVIPSATGPSSVYYSARSGNDSVFYSASSELGISQIHSRRMKRLKRETAYESLLRSTGVELDADEFTQNWSGRGQHIEFANDDIGKVNQLLTVQDTLGTGNTAVVHSVRCRRILLARKTIYTNKRFSKRKAAKEVAHLTRIKHAHVVRLIGTYTWKSELSILMYPVADHNLNSFLDSLMDSNMSYGSRNHHLWKAMEPSYWGLFSCLSSALSHIHSTLTKHLDIKPQNILIRADGRGSYEEKGNSLRVYIADFGIARSYQTSDAIDTDSSTAFTRKYAAPEVVQQDFRGLSADVFSLGCVFLEMFATFNSVDCRTVTQLDVRTELQAILSSGPESSYHSHLVALRNYLSSGHVGRRHSYGPNGTYRNLVPLIVNMISPIPRARPTALHLSQQLPARECCTSGPDKLEEAPKCVAEVKRMFGTEIEAETDHFLQATGNILENEHFIVDLPELEEEGFLQPTGNILGNKDIIFDLMRLKEEEVDSWHFDKDFSNKSHSRHVEWTGQRTGTVAFGERH
ncbi:hypothetical protein HBI31_100110 [Parastagonospora nodorum]|nr:hypothetical protein HBI31_100110 [Parastagonospora nodorum]